MVPLGLTTAALATEAAIQKKIFGSGRTTSIFQINLIDIMKTFKSFQDAGLLIKGVSKTVENELKKQKGGFLGMSNKSWQGKIRARQNF